MASITSLMGSSSSSSIYGTKNVISGLASGMDTESMIQNSVTGYQSKIASLQQKQTKLEWEQTAYRSIIDKMSVFSDKYTSYTSSTNLMSFGFFNNAVEVTGQGANAKYVSASGKTSSDIEILGVKQLAQAATYTCTSLGGEPMNNRTVGGEQIDLSASQPMSKISGTLKISYGKNRTYTLEFGELENYEDAAALQEGIRKKLSEQTMTLNDGTTVKASERIDVVINDEGNIEFLDKSDAQNGVTIKSASGNLRTALGVDTSGDSSVLNVAGKGKADFIDETETKADYIIGKQLTVTLDGVTKTITFTEDDVKNTDGNPDAETLKNALQTKLEKEFGAGKIKIKDSVVEDGSKLTLNFEVQDGSTLRIEGGIADVLGLGENGVSTAMDTGKKLGDILKQFAWDTGYATMVEAADGEKTKSEDGDYYTDVDGNRVKQAADGNWYRVDDEDNFLHKLEVNGETVGFVSKESALETVMNSMNNNSESDVSVSYSKITNQFLFSSKETGVASKIEFGGLAKELFGDPSASGSSYQRGQDAVASVSVNGQTKELTRSQNAFDLDGLKVNLKGTFNYTDEKVEATNRTGYYEAMAEGKDKDGITSTTLDADGYYVDDNGQRLKDAEGKDIAGQFKTKLDKTGEAVQFESATNADVVVDAIKSMINDYNAIASEIKKAYSTLPLKNAQGKYYQPLTEKDQEDMSESAIKAYEEKAKTGLLFGDKDLSALYQKLTSALTLNGKEAAKLESIGIKTTYSNGLTTLTLDESKLRSALETEPDTVRDAFTKQQQSSSDAGGLMQRLKGTLDAYAKTTGTKGILVQKAGSALAPTSLYQNTIQSKMDDLESEIEKWQKKMSDKVDYYTSKFTQLEKLISEMNSQSSALTSMMGGY